MYSVILIVGDLRQVAFTGTCLKELWKTGYSLIRYCKKMEITCSFSVWSNKDRLFAMYNRKRPSGQWVARQWVTRHACTWMYGKSMEL